MNHLPFRIHCGSPPIPFRALCPPTTSTQVLLVRSGLIHPYFQHHFSTKLQRRAIPSNRFAVHQRKRVDSNNTKSSSISRAQSDSTFERTEEDNQHHDHDHDHDHNHDHDDSAITINNSYNKEESSRRVVSGAHGSRRAHSAREQNGAIGNNDADEDVDEDVDVDVNEDAGEDEESKEKDADEEDEGEEVDEEIDEEIDEDYYDGETEYTMEKSTSYLQRFRIGSLTLPDDLRYTITDVLKNVDRKELRENATDLSKRLRDRTTISIPKEADAQLQLPKTEYPTIPYDKDEAVAYIAHRMPGVYGCVYRVLDELATRQPSFSPRSMLDFGSGPGTAVWAACSVWTGLIKRILAVEPSNGMTDAAKKMLEGLPVRWQRYLFENQSQSQSQSQPQPQQPSKQTKQPHPNQQGKEKAHHTSGHSALRYDIVTCSYVLSELGSNKSRRQVVRSLWKMVEPGGVLVMVDAGTPLAFRYLKDLRAMLLQDAKNEEAVRASQGKPVLVAPCPHSDACPMGANSWCHFVQRVERTPLQLAAKPNSSQSFEDEKFTYFIFQKEPLDSPMPDNVGEFYDEDNPIFQKGWSRMVRHPLKKGGHIVLDACTPEGSLKRVIVSRAAGKQMYNEARKTSWGDGFLIDKSSKLHETPSIFMKGIKRVNITDEDIAKEDNEAGDDVASTEEAQQHRHRTSEQMNDDDDEWKDEITETELKPPSFSSSAFPPRTHPPSSTSTTTSPTRPTTRPGSTASSSSSPPPFPQSQQQVSGPISWARDVLMGKGHGQPRENVAPSDTWLDGIKDKGPPLPPPQHQQGKQQYDAPTKDESSARSEDKTLLQKHKYRVRMEKDMADKLRDSSNVFPPKPKR